MKKSAKILLMILPAVCFAITIYLLTHYAYNTGLESSPVFNLILSSSDNLSQSTDMENDLTFESTLEGTVSETTAETTEITVEEQTEETTEPETSLSSEKTTSAVTKPADTTTAKPKPVTTTAKPKPVTTTAKPKPAVTTQAKTEAVTTAPPAPSAPVSTTPFVPKYTTTDGIKETDEAFPIISYGDQWATLTVGGWSKKDIPVFYGDHEDYLDDGAGQWTGSYFCGYEKNCVLSGHVMSWFYDLQDTEVGSEVIMQTIYGTYKYEVTDKFVFEESKTDTLYKDYGGDTLLLYTCYPRTLQRTKQRCAIVCSLKEGLIYENPYE